MPARESGLASTWRGVRDWLSERLRPAEGLSRRRLVLVCTILFLLATAVRLLYWQDSNAHILRDEMALHGMTTQYRDQTTLMRELGGVLFPSAAVDPSDARMVAHPPGYSILIAAMLRLFGEDEKPLRLMQVLVDAAAAVLVVLIAARLLPFAVAIIAGTLAALSPHFAYYSILLVPDSLSAIPILLAVYLVIWASKRPRLISVIAAGALIGVSCWLRSNALLLAPFLALAVWVLFERTRRLRYSLALIGATILVIAPITIRNWMIYRTLIPISVGAGIILAEGIADYDKDGRFGLPLTDAETLDKEAEWFGRPEYARSLWTPDGVDRDRARFARGLAVVTENPGWFLTVMLRRMGFMLRYNDFGRQNSLYNTTLAPTISPTPGFGHGLAIPEGAGPIWTASAPILIGEGEILSQRAEVSLAEDGDAVHILGDDSEGGDVFASAPIAIERDTDYLIKASVYLEQGRMDIKVQSAADRRIVLDIAPIPEPDRKLLRKSKKDRANLGMIASAPTQMRYEIQSPFASGDVREVRLVISSNSGPAERPRLQLSRLELFAVGPTPHLWTRYPRAALRAVQKNLFKTERLLPLVLIGVGLVAVARRGRTLMILLIVPAYYLLVQSALHTEYRYILGMHYFLFVFAAVTLFCAGTAIRQGALWAKSG